MGELPTLPTVYMRLSQLLSQPESSIKTISHIISEDPAIAAMVLKIVNSAAYGFRNRIGDLQHAIVLLGMNEIKNLVLAGSFYKMVRGFESGKSFDMKDFWRHSIGCAIVAKVLAEAADMGSPEDLFTGGLLHDIGKLIHATYLPDDFYAVVSDVSGRGLQIHELEKDRMGIDHAQTGGVLAEKWRLPRKTVDMITYHHMSNMPAMMTQEMAAIHVGNSLCIALCMGSGGDKRVPVVNGDAWKILGLRFGDLEYVMGRALRLFQDSVSIMDFE